jgi:outer membrane protein assembly factor BamE (lipoprotein component of BamABCDE complex)
VSAATPAGRYGDDAVQRYGPWSEQENTAAASRVAQENAMRARTHHTTTNPNPHARPPRSGRRWRRAAPRAALAAAGAVMLAGASGCLVTQTKHKGVTGASVANDDLARVQPGSSTPAEVEAILGPPTLRTAAADGSGEVWTWRWEERTAGAGAVFLIFGGSDSKVVEQAVNVEFRNGVVARKWRG